MARAIGKITTNERESERERDRDRDVLYLISFLSSLKYNPHRCDKDTTTIHPFWH